MQGSGSAEALLQGSVGLVIFVVLAALAIVFLVLWLRTRGQGGDGDLRKELRDARNEIKLLRADAIQSEQNHKQALQKQQQELDNLRAITGGREPPELEQWRKRAQDAEARLESERKTLEERHRAQLEALEQAYGEKALNATMISPNVSSLHDRVAGLEEEVAAARRQLEEAEAKRRQDLKALSERLAVEKAAAMTALEERYRRQVGGVGAESLVNTDAALTGEAANAPESAKYPFLEVVEGAADAGRFYLPFGETTIGRSATNSIMIEEALASRLHARITFDGTDFVLQDQKSRNGTFLNDKPIDTARLDFGDIVSIGSLRMRFTCAAVEAADKDPGFASAGLQAMLAMAPKFRAALNKLKEILEHGGGDREKAAQVQQRLDTLGAVPAATHATAPSTTEAAP